MERIYLDNASTTFPKPTSVADSVYRCMTGPSCSINRSSGWDAMDAQEAVFETRQLLCAFFGGSRGQNVVFTKNATEGLNVILKGFLRPGDHILVSSMEHNAMVRPLFQLAEKGVALDRIPCDGQGNLCIEALESLVRPNTKAVAMLHAGNVCGTAFPISQVGEFCRERGLKFFVDSSQSAGVLPIDMERMHIDALVFTGHKGLLGPQGIGGFILEEGMVRLIEPLLSGGTGSVSHSEKIPAFMPDRFEPGTMNLPGIVGLKAGVEFLTEIGIDAVRQHELALTAQFLSGLETLENRGLLTVFGRKDLSDRVGVVSLQPRNVELAQAARQLDQLFRIQTRVGLHCAPWAHRTLGTYPEGTIRFSFGWWNTPEQVDRALQGLDQICSGA